MTKEEWIKLIRRQCKKAGTYQKYFDSVIETLAKVLEDRDRADEQFAMSGSNPTVVHTNKGGQTNIVKNPILVIRTELNTQAIVLWKELGLTPKGLRALTAEVVQKENDASLEKLLSNLGG